MVDISVIGPPLASLEVSYWEILLLSMVRLMKLLHGLSIVSPSKEFLNAIHRMITVTFLRLKQSEASFRSDLDE